MARPLAVTVLWTFAAALVGALIIGLAALIVGGFTWVVWIFDRATSVTGAMADTVRIGGWIFAPIGLAAAVWAAAYGTTQQDSLPRTLIAAPVAIGVAVGMLLLGSSGLLAASLGIGWALAIPARTTVQVAARALPLLVAALVVPDLGELSVPRVVAILLISPLVAAVVVLVADLPWGMKKGPSESN